MESQAGFLPFLFAALGMLAAFGALALYLKEKEKLTRARDASQELELELAGMNPQLEELQRQRDALKEELDETEDSLRDHEREAAKLEQQLKDMQAERGAFEKYKEEFKHFAKSSVMEAGSQLSTKLLEDHKREAERVQKVTQEEAKQQSQKLVDQYQKATETLAQLHGNVQANSKQMDTVMRALSNPGGAGMMAEVGLENTLKQVGLEPGRDFAMQVHVAGEGANLRPDAMVYLPQETVMVIDAKASKFLLELAEVEGTEQELVILKKLVATMHTHLKALANRDYKQAILLNMRKEGRTAQPSRIWNVMYLPSEAALEKIRRTDKSFQEQLRKYDIMAVGPSGLQALFSLAKSYIAEANQKENQQHIIALLSDLLDSTTTTLSHMGKVGNAIKSSAEHFDKFAKSLNRNVLPKMSKLSGLGIEHKKELPHAIASYEVRRSDDVVEMQLADSEDEAESSDGAFRPLEHKKQVNG